MEAPSSTTSTNSAGKLEQPRGVHDVLPWQPSSKIERLGRYLELADADYLNDDLARTILATLNGSEFERLTPQDLRALRRPFLKVALALCRWLADRQSLPITQIIRAVPRLRRMMPEGDLDAQEPAFEDLVRSYHQAKRSVHRACGEDTAGRGWSNEAKRAVLTKIVVDGFREGMCVAFENLFRDVVIMGGFFPFDLDPADLAESMDDGGWYDQLSTSDLDNLAQSLIRVAPLMTTQALHDVLLFLNFRASARLEHCARVNEAIIVPLSRRLLTLGMNEQGCTAVHWSLLFYGHRLPSEAEFSRWVAAFAPAAAAAGRRLAQPDARALGPVHHNIRLAFITRGGTVSAAATDHFLAIMEHLRHEYASRFTVCLYVYDMFDPDMQAHCDDRGVRVRFISDEGFGSERITDKLVWLRQILADDEVDVAIWTHAFDFVYFAFGMRLAPIQILFSQYLHPEPDLVEVDGYLTWGSPVLRKQKFGGHFWRVVPSALRFDPTEIDGVQIERLRRIYAVDNETILVGTLARAEKVGQPDYMAAIQAILERHPNVVFLWTGSTEHVEITGAFKKSGVLGRTRFIGWVDIHLYARVFDILLDTFPLSNGITALAAMRSGTPILSLATPLSFVGRDIVPAFEPSAPAGSRHAELGAAIRKLFGDQDADALPAARDPSDFVAKASRLIEDREFRARYGEAWQRVYRLIYADEKLMTDTFVNQLIEIIGEQASLDAPSGRSDAGVGRRL